MQEFTVYIIHSQSTDRYYIGHTSNLQDRLKRHNKNRSKYTKGKGPWNLVETLIFNSKKEAYQMELKLKRMKNSKKAIEYIKRIKA
ncbi:MAG: GIY-YIG nuclease family protein [Ignavibacteriae bacterium]|nr:GIY-YIG nuclease family protein [Ignavibacteriota bacterium]NOH00011.1 GIY-YIG nuclease family protein [Ignavibacteriota bacterium]